MGAASIPACALEQYLVLAELIVESVDLEVAPHHAILREPWTIRPSSSRATLQLDSGDVTIVDSHRISVRNRS